MKYGTRLPSEPRWTGRIEANTWKLFGDESKLKRVRELALAEMAEHELLESGWSFDFDRAIRRQGCCHLRTKKITLSRLFSVWEPESEVLLKVIRHEIAHALVGPQRKPHGPKWRAMAERLGAMVGA